MFNILIYIGFLLVIWLSSVSVYVVIIMWTLYELGCKSDYLDALIEEKVFKRWGL